MPRSATSGTGTATPNGSTTCQRRGQGVRAADRGAATAGGTLDPPIDVAAANGRADSGDLELDLTELFSDVAELARDLGVGVAVFIDEMQDIARRAVRAVRRLPRDQPARAPLVVVGAGLPHLPTALSATKSYAERLFHYRAVDRLAVTTPTGRCSFPRSTEHVEFDAGGAGRALHVTDGYPYFVQAYGKATWDVAPRGPIRADDVKDAAPQAEAELAVGFFGSRYERATPAEREYMRAMAELGAERADGRCSTADVAGRSAAGRSALSPARDGLIKKGLVYAEERGSCAFTVPHFGAFLRSQHG